MSRRARHGRHLDDGKWIDHADAGVSDRSGHRDGLAETVKMGRLRSDEITFSAGDVAYKGKVTGNTIEGTMTTAQGTAPWTATRK